MQASRSEQGQVAQIGYTASERARSELDKFLSDAQSLSANVATNAANIYQPSIQSAQGVPITMAGLDYGQAASNQAQLMGGLGNLGTQLIMSQIPQKTNPIEIRDYTKSGNVGDLLSERLGSRKNPFPLTGAITDPDNWLKK